MEIIHRVPGQTSPVLNHYHCGNKKIFHCIPVGAYTELLPLVLSMYTSEKSLVTSSLYSSAAYLSSRRKRLRFPLSLLFPSQCKSHSLDLLAALLLNAEGVPLVFLSSKDVLLTVVEFPVNQKPHGFSHRGATCVGSFKPILLHGVTLS